MREVFIALDRLKRALDPWCSGRSYFGSVVRNSSSSTASRGGSASNRPAGMSDWVVTSRDLISDFGTVTVSVIVRTRTAVSEEG